MTTDDQAALERDAAQWRALQDMPLPLGAARLEKIYELADGGVGDGIVEVVRHVLAALHRPEAIEAGAQAMVDKLSPGAWDALPHTADDQEMCRFEAGVDALISAAVSVPAEAGAVTLDVLNAVRAAEAEQRARADAAEAVLRRIVYLRDLQTPQGVELFGRAMTDAIELLAGQPNSRVTPLPTAGAGPAAPARISIDEMRADPALASRTAHELETFEALGTQVFNAPPGAPTHALPNAPATGLVNVMAYGALRGLGIADQAAVVANHITLLEATVAELRKERDDLQLALNVSGRANGCVDFVAYLQKCTRAGEPVGSLGQRMERIIASRDAAVRRANEAETTVREQGKRIVELDEAFAVVAEDAKKWDRTEREAIRCAVREARADLAASQTSGSEPDAKEKRPSAEVELDTANQDGNVAPVIQAHAAGNPRASSEATDLAARVARLEAMAEHVAAYRELVEGQIEERLAALEAPGGAPTVTDSGTLDVEEQTRKKGSKSNG